MDKKYKCIYCGELLPFKDLCCIDNKTNTGICYKKDCLAKENKRLERIIEFTPTELEWEQLFMQGNS